MTYKLDIIMYSMLDILHREIFVVLEYLCFTRGRVPGAGMTLVICEVGAAYVSYKMTVFPQMKGL